jgi:uncharacterized protein (DUF342 family)
MDRKEDRTELYAEANGRLVFDGQKFYVQDKLIFKEDLSSAVGNVKFSGRVDVRGSVLSNVCVSAGESVYIREVVQEALVTSDRDITIGQGIKGGGKAVVRAQGKLTLGFAEEANLLTVGDIEVSKAFMNCKIKCNGKIRSVAAKTRIIGGVIKAKEGLTVHTVGSERSPRTMISFGQDYLVENQIEVLNTELEKLRDYILKIDALMDKIALLKNEKKLMEVRKKKLKSLKLIEKKNLRLFLLEEKYEQHFPSEVTVTGMVFPGVTFESHGRTLEISEPCNGLTVFFNSDNGHLQIKK